MSNKCEAPSFSMKNVIIAMWAIEQFFPACFFLNWILTDRVVVLPLPKAPQLVTAKGG